jgi:uncharacterized membrane protein
LHTQSTIGTHYTLQPPSIATTIHINNNYALLLLSVEDDDDGPISRRQNMAAENDTVATAHAVAYFFHHGDLRTAIIISLFRSINSEHDFTIVLYPTGGSGDDHDRTSSLVLNPEVVNNVS